MRKIPVSELALAYELRCEGVCWKQICRGLGHEHIHLRNALNYVLEHGFRSNA